MQVQSGQHWSCQLCVKLGKPEFSQHLFTNTGRASDKRDHRILIRKLTKDSQTLTSPMRQTFKFGHKNNSCQNTFFGWTQPPWRVPRLSSTSCAALLQAANSRRNVSSHHPQQPELEADELTFPTKNDWATPCPVKQLLGEVLPIWQPMLRPPTASDTLPPQNHHHPTTSHHVTNIQIRSQKQLMSKHIFWLNPTSVEGSKTFINELRSSATGNQFRLECVTTPPAPANTRSSSFGISNKERLSHSLPCETAPKRSSSNLAADASSTYGIRHTATTKQQSSYNIAPCDKHATFVTILFCPTGPACVVPRHPAIERAALQPQATSCPVHGQHSEHVPFCEAPWQKFLPGHPGAIHDPWSQHCYAAPATEFPRHRTTRTTRSHAPFARTFPSANETATTKCPQTSRVRDLNQTFCIQKFRDMHICSLDFKTMPWHAWFQNKTMPWHAWFQNKEFEFRTILCHWATLVQTTASLCGLNLGVARTIESSCIAVALHFNIQFPTQIAKCCKLHASHRSRRKHPQRYNEPNSLVTSTTSCTNLLHTRTIQCQEFVLRSLRPRLLRLTCKHHCRIDMQTEQWSLLWTLFFLCHVSHKSTALQTNADMITMQFSRSHGQPLQKPREVQQMLQIPVCQSSLVSRTFSVHIRIWCSLRAQCTCI